MAKKLSIEEQVEVELKDCRFHADCMALLVKRYRKYDRNLNIFLAITSSSSIAGWAIWSKWAMAWGIIIAASQVVTALKPIFSFNRHVHTLNTRCHKQEFLFLELDGLWHGLKNKEMSNDNAKTKLEHLKQRITENEFFDDDDSFEPDQEILEKASEMTADILETKYNITN